MISSNSYAPAIARNLEIPIQQVTETLSLLDAGGTVPFIARYRKEATGSLDEVAIDRIRIEQDKLREIEKRRHSIIDSLTKNDQITDKLLGELQGAESLTTLEDIYLPHRPKRKTRALMAAEKGLQPLAELLLSGRGNFQDIDRFITPERGVDNQRMALDGARDIIAEKVSEDQNIREKLRTLFLKRGIITTKVVKKNIDQGEKFSNYFDWQEAASEAPGHRLLAMFRGETSKILTLTIRPPREEALRILTRLHVPSNKWQKMWLLLYLPFCNRIRQGRE